MSSDDNTTSSSGLLWGLSGYHWAVLWAAWIGWGFDVFDALLFNYVAGNCVPTLSHIPLGTPEAREVTALWTGRLTSILLLGWAVGGIFFGWLADRIGRAKTLLITIGLYAMGTALCAFAPNMAVLTFFRICASLGIGGEWAAGAAMVAEVVPAKKRLEAGAFLYTAAPVGLILASWVNQFVAGTWLKGSPETSWRYVFLFGLLPAIAAVIMRLFLKEPERAVKPDDKPASIGELFVSPYSRLTISGLLMAIVALVSWWSVSAFMPMVAAGLAREHAAGLGLSDPSALGSLQEAWKTYATYYFSIGGLFGTLATVPIAKRFGRKPMFAFYYLLSALALGLTFGLSLTPSVRLSLYSLIGMSIFGVFGSFTYYLPELFPARLRATGSGFCYNIGRVLTALGPLWVGVLAQQGHLKVMSALCWMALVPLAGVLALPWVVETKDRDPEHQG